MTLADMAADDLAGLVLFTASSLWCGLSGSAGMLILVFV